MRNQYQLLMDNRYTCLLGIFYPVNLGLLAIYNDFTPVRDIDTAQHINQSGFTSAIFSQHSMDFTRFQLKINVIQSKYARERLSDILHFQ